MINFSYHPFFEDHRFVSFPQIVLTTLKGNKELLRVYNREIFCVNEKKKIIKMWIPNEIIVVTWFN